MKDIEQEIQNIKNNIAFIADTLEIQLPHQPNHHDCRIYSIEMSGNKNGDIFLNMKNFFHKKISVQVKFCPICGFEGNEPPLMVMSTFDR